MNKHALAIAVSAILPFSAVAGTEFAGINFTGFATVAGGQSFGDDEYTTSRVDGYYETLSFEPGTLAGIQATTSFWDDILGVTVQAVVDGGNSWDVDLTWAFLSVDATDNWRVLLGRQVMPHYMYSDYINVSYAYHWIEAPSELYNAPFDSFNGISSNYTFEFDESSLFTQLIYGEEPDTDQGKSYEDIWGAKLSYNYDWLTVNLAYFEFEESQTRTNPRTGEEDTISGVLESFDVGFQIEYDNWLIVSEITSVNLEDVSDQMGTIQPWMISVAYRFGSIMPHVTYGKDRMKDFNDTDSSTPFYTVGVRWDFHSSSALKLEYSREENDEGYVGESMQLAVVTMF